MLKIVNGKGTSFGIKNFFHIFAKNEKRWK